MKLKYSSDFSLGPFMTFEYSKTKPIHGWFWYKEGYAPELVDYAIHKFNEDPTTGKLNVILDPFCGVGTTLLAAKSANVRSIGVDASQLAVFVSRTKTADYSAADLESALVFLSNPPRAESATLNWPFELFPARAAFPRRNYTEILQLRAAIEQEAPKVRDLLLLALLSILPQASIVLKDGGVLKIDRHKRALPARELFRRKVKRMVSELGQLDGVQVGAQVEGISSAAQLCAPASHHTNTTPHPSHHTPAVFLGDARALDLESESVDLIVTSPPYLNNIDYSKVYGLELSLLDLSTASAEETRMRAVRSFIKTGGKALAPGCSKQETAMPEEVGEIGYRIPIIGTYFADMEAAIKEMFRVLRPGGHCYINVSNSVIHETHVLVDEVFAEMAERIGFTDVGIVVCAERIADVKPAKVKTRESIVIMRKA